MSNLSYQRRMAADLLKCGVNRVYIDPDRIDEVQEAVTRTDIRVLINLGAIKARQKRGISNARRKKYLEQKRKGRRSGPGSRKGKKYARYPRKQRWIKTIRPQRRVLKALREDEVIDRKTYRHFYSLAGGGMFKNVHHMLLHMKMDGAIDEDTVKKYMNK